MTYRGRWYGDSTYVGLHYDLHAGAGDTELGTRCGEDELVLMLELMAPDFVQTDCKGHAGYTSWFSSVENASVPEGLTQDALSQWRSATRKLGLPLHCHYSGIWDQAAGAKHPEWCVITAEGQGAGAPFGQNAGAPTFEKMCPRSPYLDELMIPQMLELIDRYEVDGFWIDGDLWAAEPCYCAACKAAWQQQTGLETGPPVAEDDPEWPRWWNFTRQSFYEFVTRYCDAVHAHNPKTLVCSNWLQTFKNPGEPTVPTDWISGDNAWVWGLDGSRCEARFLSTRGKPWDIMLWNFYCSHGMGGKDSPWTVKPPQMLMQEAAVLLAFGGNVQIYEHPPVRDGRLVPWRQQRLAEVTAFIKERREICQNTTTIPQVAVLHSDHLYSAVKGKNLMWNVDAAPVQGALFALLENSYGVDILDEWALLPRLGEFPLVVAPEQTRMSEAMVMALKQYAEAGGALLLSASAMFDRFGEDFLGFCSHEIQSEQTYVVPTADGSVPLYSSEWRLGETSTGESIGVLGRGELLADKRLPNPAATVNRVGEGMVAYVPADLFRDVQHNRYPMTRQFVGAIIERLMPQPAIRVSAPACIDVALRQRSDTTVVHLINRASGIPNLPNCGVIDEIPPVGPIAVQIQRTRSPKQVTMALEDGRLDWEWDNGCLSLHLATVNIHAAAVVGP